MDVLEESQDAGATDSISDVFGVPLVAFKVLVTILIAYPLAICYRKYIYSQPTQNKHGFFIAMGFLLGIWNFGTSFLHFVFATLFTHATLTVLGGTDAAVGVTFLFNMGYLLIGYCYSATEHYDINWTLPQCVLTLKLIGLAFDYHDGHQPPEKLSSEGKKSALVEKPSVLETLGYALFPGGFLVGPQFSMRRYRDFVAGEFEDKDTKGSPPESCVAPAIIRFLCGLGYVTAYQILGLFVNDDYIVSAEFDQERFVKKSILLGVWGRYNLYKYMSVWLLAEGSCILFGLTHNGTGEDGKVRWDGLANVDLVRLETATEFNHYILSFNINTNHWVAQYIYKRLKFLGNRYLSQIGALLFLSVWHGFHTGYYVCFLFEFLVIYMERDVQGLLSHSRALKSFFANGTVAKIVYVVLRVYTFIFMGWCLLPFVLLTVDRYWAAYRNVNYMGILLFIMYPVVYAPILRFVLKKMGLLDKED